MLRALLVWVACVSLAGCDGERSGSDASVALDAPAADAGADTGSGGLPICPSPSPMEGSPCSAGEGCMIPGSPCFFELRCVAGAWDPSTICPSPDAGP